jgi:Fungal Zn(2)-Cys(6) binuclear cluster domain
MSITYSHVENPSHTLHFQSMNFNYNGGRHGQDQTNRQYRLPPPHSSIPIGLIVDNDREDQQTRSPERTDLSHSRNDLPPPREQLPSVHQLLSSERNAGYLPPPIPPQTSHFQGRSLQTSPSIHPRSPDSQLNHPNNLERAPSNYPSSRGREYEPYHTPQPARLPSLSQVGIEPASHARAPENPRARFVPDEDSLSQFAASGDLTISPTQSVHSTSSHLVPHLRQEAAVPHQVVDERYLPGKGVCYIFADNSYCPKLIDGQPVNPNWGLTKAGKARKRLAQACIPCREKKVKCQPNLPKCDQCQKSGRECRFENA